MATYHVYHFNFLSNAELPPTSEPLPPGLSLGENRFKSQAVLLHKYIKVDGVSYKAEALPISITQSLTNDIPRNQNRKTAGRILHWVSVNPDLPPLRLSRKPADELERDGGEFTELKTLRAGKASDIVPEITMCIKLVCK